MKTDRAQLHAAGYASRRALPVYGLMAAIAILLVFFLPRWWSWVVLALTVATLIGDVINVAYAKRRVRPITPHGKDGA
jgi:hypothetical protein